MSIYGARRSWKDFSDIFQETPIADETAEPPPSMDAGSEQWREIRKAAPAGYLLPSTRRWVERLPVDVYPKLLAKRYPRIVNMIAAQWNDRAGCPKLFEDLLGDRRGERSGFPPDAYRDIVGLQEYWYNGHGLR